MHACYSHLPLEPGANFPSDVRDDGAFPPEPYDFAFWGFPCIKHSSLNRTATEADLVDALDLLGRALRQLSENPPLVFVLENTHSLLSGPRWVLARITSMLRQLPYDWRFAPCPRASGQGPTLLGKVCAQRRALEYAYSGCTMTRHGTVQSGTGEVEVGARGFTYYLLGGGSRRNFFNIEQKSRTSPSRRARSAMLNTFLVCTGFSPTSAALRPAHAPFAATTPRSIPATMLAKRRASGGGKAEVAYTVLEEDGSDVWRADDAVAVIRSGGVGVIPTDTGYDDARAQSRVVWP